MNSQKTGQALKEILDKCREGGVQKERAAFKAALFDLLGGSKFVDERLVLKHAMDANSFWTLLKTAQLTPDSAKKAAERIAKESHMAKEDAEFVVRCIATAQGADPEIVNAGKSGETDSTQKTDAAQSGGQETENTVRQDADPLLLSAKCKINCNWARIKKSKGKVYFYKGYLRFVPDAGDVYGVKNDATEISYSDIKRFNDMKATFVFWYIMGFFYLILCFAADIAMGVFYVMFLLLIIGICHFAVRKYIFVKKSFLKHCSFWFSKHADKKTAMSILKTWTS